MSNMECLSVNNSYEGMMLVVGDEINHNQECQWFVRVHVRPRSWCDHSRTDSEIILIVGNERMNLHDMSRWIELSHVWNQLTTLYCKWGGSNEYLKKIRKW